MLRRRTWAGLAGLSALALMAALATSGPSAAPRVAPAPVSQQSASDAQVGRRAVAGVNPVLRTMTQKICLSWNYQTGQPWHCSKWFSQKTSTLGVVGRSVYSRSGSNWKLQPYVYNASTRVATYDYRIDSSLWRPAYSSLGSVKSYYFDALASNGKPTQTLRIKWPVCQKIGWTIDFHGIGGTTLNKTAELARWNKAFAKVTAASRNHQQFLYLNQSIYKPGSSATKFEDRLIHITYSTTAAGAYHSTLVTSELGYGGLHWMTDGNGNFLRINWGFVIIDATKASNMVVWPSPSRPKGVDELLNLYQHELGHALGLQHTPKDKYQAMFPQLLPQLPNRLGAGDVRAYQTIFPAVPCPPRPPQ
jgi:hypothetical protein